MKTSHHVDVLLVAANISHDLNARLVQAAHQTIKSGHELALCWPYANRGELGLIARYFGDETALKALVDVVEPLSRHELIRLTEIREAPISKRFIMVKRDRSIEKRKTPAALERCNKSREAIGKAPLGLKTKSPGSVSEINMISGTNGRNFTMFIRSEACEPDAQTTGGSQYGFGIPVPFF